MHAIAVFTGGGTVVKLGDYPYGELLAATAIRNGDMDVTKHDVAYLCEDMTLGRLATYVLPDEIEVDGVRYVWNDSRETYVVYR